MQYVASKYTDSRSNKKNKKSPNLDSLFANHNNYFIPHPIYRIKFNVDIC